MRGTGASPIQAPTPTTSSSATTSSSESGRITHAYVITEYWCPEDLAAAKGMGSRLVATLKSLEGANAYAAAYKDDVIKQIRKALFSDPWDLENAKKISARIKVHEETSDDGEKTYTVDWAHTTEIVVRKMPLLDSMQDAEMPEMIMSMEDIWYG